MPDSDALIETRRELEICNACRYCEGYCAVFPAMELRREFASGDLDYLANLCHNCRGCFYACQYAPPHEFDINLPRTLARLRMETWRDYAWPAPLGRLFERNGLLVSLALIVAISVVFLTSMTMSTSGVFYARHTGAGAFYAIIPRAAMIAVAGVTLGFSLLAMLASAVRFWRGTGGGRPTLKAVLVALHHVMSLKNLDGGGHGCNDIDEGLSMVRRRLHHCLFYGFLLCFASTSIAFVYDHFLGVLAPYPWTSWPVLAGIAGGMGILTGTAGLLVIKLKGDRVPTATEQLGSDTALLLALFMTALTGLMLLALRDTMAMGSILAIHLGCVLAFFVTMPYSRFVHGIYRTAALVRNAMEQ